MQKIVAKLYGVWGADKYYRTESGHTFSAKATPGGLVVFYHGNTFNSDHDGKPWLLNDAEKAELFERVKFED